MWVSCGGLLTAFNSLFEMPPETPRPTSASPSSSLSILYLRCKPQRRSSTHSSTKCSFNSLFEMLCTVPTRGYGGRTSMLLSILYLRCREFAKRYAVEKLNVTFNSLFEMRRIRAAHEPDALRRHTFNSLFEMLSPILYTSATLLPSIFQFSI